MLEFIRENVAPDEILATLAEEAVELSHAALKLRRTLSDANPTNISYDDALANLKEEIADVRLLLMVLDFDWYDRDTFSTIEAKLARWVQRLRGEGQP